ncbi:GAP1-N2 domain-containing protein [Bremerella alba]|uniref:GTPase-associated protein 1 N-terminal domain-containing protein n=1 Tax=Bremerella alba TaxID=980252 RepID=A0A7V9A7S0_9BACT|nr:hypothetical protein [Bremerella alba]MBA2115672.1 hypothetical protein [Bremerella alba]
MAPLSPKDLQVAPAQQKQPSGTVSVEQAIFTSARTSSKDGYQLVAWSPGIGSDDARQLAVWGPAHDSMIVEDPTDVSLNFHPLGDHKYCISRTVLGAAEYSGRGGRQVYTHCFVLDAASFTKFQNDPFRVLSAALAIHDLRPGAKLPSDLPSLKMLPSGPPVDAGLIRFFDSPVQQQSLVAWTHHALMSKKLMFTGGYNDRFLTVFFNLLPVSIRPEFSFSTRLRYSPRRNFRLIGLANDMEEQKRAARQEGCSVFQFDSPARTPEASRHPWATWVQVALCHREPDEAARLIGEVPLTTRLEDLSAIGNRLRVAMSGKRIKEAAAAPAASSPLVVPEDNTDRGELLVLVERALEGDVTALERLNATWCAQPDRQLEALRQDCARHFLGLSRDKRFEPGSKGAVAVEILSLILRVSP